MKNSIPVSIENGVVTLHGFINPPNLNNKSGYNYKCPVTGMIVHAGKTPEDAVNYLMSIGIIERSK